MKASAVVFPVLFMIALGITARYRSWLSPQQKEGASQLAVKILFPILIFSLMCKVQLNVKDIGIVVYVTCAYLAAGIIGKILSKKLAPKYARLAGYLLMTNEGGNIALPLFLSIVGSSTITVVFDLAVIFVNFVIVPILVQHTLNQQQDVRSRLIALITNPFLVAAFLGLICSLSGFYGWLMHSAAADLVTKTLDTATAAVIPVILFCLGYNMNVESEIWKPILKLSAARLFLYSLIIAGFFVFFPALMEQKTFFLAVMIYFMSPTSFGLIPSILPLYRNGKDAAFVSSFTSAYMTVTLIVFIGCALWAG